MKDLPFPYDGVFRWVGLDGTPFIVTSREGRFTGHGIWNDVGLVCRDKNTRVTEDLANAQTDPADFLLIYTTEEALITKDISKIVDMLNRNGKRKIAFRNAESFFDAAEKDNVPHVYGEFNPVFTGCYATRISIKHDNRKAENQLFESEFLDLYRKGKGKDFTPVWKQLFLVGFHDAICGCHSDHANEQIREKLDFVLNATRPSMPAAKVTEFSVVAMNQNTGIQLASSPIPPDGISERGRFLSV